MNVQNAGGVATTYTYDYENRLLKVVQGSTTVGAYGYSTSGTRVLSIESGVTTVSLSLGVSVLYEKLSSSNKPNYFVVANGLLIARLNGNNVYYYHQDHLGNTRLVTQGSSTSFTSNYQPYGVAYASSGVDPVYKYTGKPQSTTGLYYYGARWYNASLGRFLTRDPIQGKLSIPQTLNPYTYVINNPLRYTDPTGEFFGLNILVGAIAGAVISGVLCAWQHTGWSNSCLVAIGVGALSGAIAGLTFNPTLFLASKTISGLTSSTALVGLGSMMTAGAVSGSVAGASSYAAETFVTGKQFTAQGLLTSTAMGALTGAAFAGAGYGFSRAAPSIFGFNGQRVQMGEGPARFWSRSTFGSSDESLSYHVGEHAPGQSATGYTNDALALSDAAWDIGRPWPIGDGPFGMFGSVGWKINSGFGWKGWYDLTGGIVSFLYR